MNRSLSRNFADVIVPRARWALFALLPVTLATLGYGYPFLYTSGQHETYLSQFDGITGQLIRTYQNPYQRDFGGMVEGPDGLLYALARSGVIMRFDPTTGQSLGDFIVDQNPGPFLPDLTFGPDGNLYILDAIDHEIHRYHGGTGAYLGVFAADPHLVLPPNLVFGPDGDLYVTSQGTDSVLRFDGETGVFLGEFAKHPDIRIPEGLGFGPDGNLYVLSAPNVLVAKFDGKTGAYLGRFVQNTLGIPLDMEFGPNHNLYVSSLAFVKEYDGRTGQFVRNFARNHLTTSYIAFSPVPEPASLTALALAFGALALRRRLRSGTNLSTIEP